MLQELQNLEELGYVRSVQHRELPLLVWNYSPKTQFEQAFGEYPVLRLCRGLITDLEGNIQARCYEKFFNWEQHETSELPLGTKDFVIEKKLDGSLLIVARIFDKIVYSTRGSFYSDQAILGEKIFNQLYNEDWIEDGITYLFELIGPSNRIVNSYEEDDLILHGLIDTQSGLDVSTDKPFKRVETIELHGAIFGEELYKTLSGMNIPNEEGFVLKVIEPGVPTWMCKIKFADYCVLHKIVTEISNRSIWEFLRDGKDFDEIIEICPDEFNTWLKKTKSALEHDFTVIENTSRFAYLQVKDMDTRKEQAMYLIKYFKDVSAVVFKMLDGSDYRPSIWGMVKPEKYVQPFTNKGEE
jgi:RNA ligase